MAAAELSIISFIILHSAVSSSMRTRVVYVLPQWVFHWHPPVVYITFAGSLQLAVSCCFYYASWQFAVVVVETT